MTQYESRRARIEAEGRTGVLPASAPTIVAEPAAIPAPTYGSRRERREAEKAGFLRITESPAANPVQLTIETAPNLIPVTAPSATVTVEEAVEEEVSFTGSNLLAEPSTNSIVLEVAPEAIALPIETGEVAITGSIAVIADPTTDTHASTLDGPAVDLADHRDTVTGVLSLVPPISALDVIEARSTVGVVPKSVLRKGWWRTWAMAIGVLVLLVVGIFATLAILNLIGA